MTYSPTTQRRYDRPVNSNEPYQLLLKAIDQQEQTLIDVSAIHADEHASARAANDDDGVAQARRLMKVREGQLEVVRAVREAALEARDVRGLSFDQMLAVMENSYLTLERGYQEQESKQQSAFRAALVGGSRAAYDSATDELNVATGRFTEIGDRLRASRNYTTD